MPPRDDLTALLDRVVDGRARPSDLARLDRVTRVRDAHGTVQVGGYNVSLRSGRDVHIGDRLYRGGDADIIRELLRDIAYDGSDVRVGATRNVAGAVRTMGMIVALTGMALFLWGLVTAMLAPPGTVAVPPVIVQGFAVAFAGVALSVVGQVVGGWRRSGRR